MRLLVAEGNNRAERESRRKVVGETPGEAYAQFLRSLSPAIETDVFDTPEAPAPSRPLSDYAGIVMTGSALSLTDDIPDVRRQVDFARAVFAAGVPFFGSCWGLQVAAVAAGGQVGRNPRGAEIGFARDIVLTEAGRIHPMHEGRPAVFDVPAIHFDIVTEAPPGLLITAENANSPIQAAEIRHGNGTFWGVQFHPEYRFRDIAQVYLRTGHREGHRTAEETAAQLMALEAAPDPADIAAKLDLGPTLTTPEIRSAEIRNWLRHQVGATQI